MKELLSSSLRKSVNNSRGLCPVKRFVNPSTGPVCAPLSTLEQRAFMSVFKLSFRNRLSLWSK